MAKKKEEIVEVVQDTFLTDPDAEPVSLREIMEELGLIGPHVKAEELKGETFVIFRAKPFPSVAGPDEIAYFCHCRDMKKQEVFTTTLGGQAVVDMLSNYIAAGVNKPIKVTLNWQEGGAFGGYYTID